MRPPLLRRGALPTAVLAAALALSACTGPSSNGPNALADAVAEAMSDARIANGAWSILAVDADTGETVYELNPAAPLLPGSIMKTFTNGTALETLGADTRLTTTVHGVGELRDGVLHGDLVLVGAGDFSFGLRDQPDGTLEITSFDHNEANTGLKPAELNSGDPLSALRELAAQLAEAGIVEVDGELIIDNRLFETETGWPDGRIDSIWVNENLYDAVLTPGATGEAPAVELRPGLRAMTLQNEAVTVSGDAVEIAVEDLGAGAVRVSGEIGVDAGETVRVAQIEDPVEFARLAFVETLADAGIAVRGAAASNPEQSLPASYEGEPLASWESATTAERVRVVQKVSYNRGADLFGCLIAVHTGSTSCVDGLAEIVATVEAHGAPAGSFFVFDPAGSVDYDRISAISQVAFLRGAIDTEWGQALYDAMPVSGVDGSLASFGGPEDQGAIHAKTGSRIVGYPATGALFYGAQSYSGYLTAESGRRLVFTVIFNAGTVDSIDAALELMQAVGMVPRALRANG